MTTLDAHNADLPQADDDPGMARLVAALDTLGEGSPSPQADLRIRHALAVQGRNLAQQARTGPRRVGAALPRRWTPLSLARLSVAVAAVAAVLLSVGTYLHGQSPTPVNAQTILHRAAAVTPGPNEATHSTYRLTVSGGYTGTLDVWVGTDGSSAPSEFALTIRMSRNGQPAPELSSQRVLTSQAMQEYDPARNTVLISSPTASDQQEAGMFVATLVAQKLNRALAAGGRPSPSILQQQTLDGVSVYAFRLDGSDQTFYFNTQSYVLEGVDLTQDGRAWQVRLDPSSYHTMPLSAVPPHTFSLNAPATATVVRDASSQGTSSGPDHDTIVQTAAAACHTTAQAFANAFQTGDKSMLAVCQETAPTMTAQQLVTALLVPFKSSLDAQVAAGTVTRTQEADELAGFQRKLLGMVTAQPGSPPAGKHP